MKHEELCRSVITRNTFFPPTTPSLALLQELKHKVFNSDSNNSLDLTEQLGTSHDDIFPSCALFKLHIGQHSFTARKQSFSAFNTSSTNIFSYSGFEEEILLDTRRTFREKQLFYSEVGPGQIMLFNILNSLSEKQDFYCQGMNFLAAFILELFCLQSAVHDNIMITDFRQIEDTVLTTLKYFVVKFDLKTLWKSGFPQLKLRIYQFNKLVRKYLPQLWKHFKEVGLNADFFVSNWFLTLFTNSFSFDFCAKFLLVFLEKGWKTVFRFGFFVLSHFEARLLELKLEDFSKFFNRQNKLFAGELNGFSGYEVYKKFKIKNEELYGLEREYLLCIFGLLSSKNDFDFEAQEVKLGLLSEIRETLKEEFDNLDKHLLEDKQVYLDRIEKAEKHLKMIYATYDRVNEELEHLESEIEDLNQAREAITAQVEHLKACTASANMDTDLNVLREKLIYVTEQLHQKMNRTAKLKNKLQRVFLLLEENEDKKAAFCDQFFYLINSVEKNKRNKLESLKMLIY